MDADDDYVHLPDVAWVQILSYLSLQDRANVSQTCQYLNDIFNHPSLWQTVQIKLIGDIKASNLSKRGRVGVVMPKQYIEMTRRFGHYFQNLSLKLHGFLKFVPEECKQIITELSRDCRLETLTLEVGTMVSRDIHPRYVMIADSELHVFAQLVENAFRLKTFNLITWPKFNMKEKTLDILECLMNNPKIEDLEVLSLYWYSAHHGTWTNYNVVLPPLEDVLRLVTHFSELTTLNLRSTMIDDEVVYELAKAGHKPLQNLGILVTYTKEEERTKMKTVSSRAWTQLCKYCPDLKVQFVISRRIPFFYLCSILKPEIPLCCMTFMKYSRCGNMDLTSITDKYNKTLQKFIDYTDACDCDVELLRLVTRCEALDHLIYNGNLKQSTVVALAEFRGDNWTMFNVNMDNIITKEQHLENEDIVINLSHDNTYQTPLFSDYESEEDREERVGNLKAKVSKCLGYNWVPMTTKCYS